MRVIIIMLLAISISVIPVFQIHASIVKDFDKVEKKLIEKQIAAKLNEKSANKKKFYKKWWFWTIVAVVVGGGVAAAAGGSGGGGGDSSAAGSPAGGDIGVGW